ncbi:MAG: NADH-quinone oxidoreductase subunit NuoK [Candidatus Eisenbacteria bacterium]|nr:NADH-quinone oxidoreductase subunit NuoK [Candidatus Latescibacterota bacterium]MBD3303033.1 NADH-quinone oxidoreductase subunit NuoK [Candidatus Eisenbacteria bacterium]
MGEVTLGHYIGLSVVLFFIGALGVLSRKNALIVLMSIELMLNAANLAFAAFARRWGQVDGHVVVIFVIAIAAVEAAIGLAILVGIFRNRQTVDLDDMTALNE